MYKNLKTFFLGFLLILGSAVHAQIETPDETCCATDPYRKVNGRFDLSAAWVHIDMTDHGHTIHKMDLGGVRAELCYLIWKGLQIRPNVLYAHGRKEDRCINGGVSLGFSIPINECYWLTPLGGVTWGKIRTTIDFPLINPTTHELVTIVPHVTEKFRSVSPYVGLEGSWKITPELRIVACYQYAWSRTHTKLNKGIGTYKNTSKGSNISGMIEYDLDCNWSVNIGGAYNASLTKEKLGVRAYGVKLGMGYWF